MQRAIGMSADSLYKTFLWEGAYYGIIASVIGSVLGYVCTVSYTHLDVYKRQVSMGIANFKRDRKKTVAIVASLSLGGIILLVVSSIVLLRRCV